MRTRRQLYMVVGINLAIAFFVFHTYLSGPKETWLPGWGDRRPPKYEAEAPVLLGDADGGASLSETSRLDVGGQASTALHSVAQSSSVPLESASLEVADFVSSRFPVSPTSADTISAVFVSATTAVPISPTSSSAPPLPDRIVVIGKTEDDDTGWVGEHLPDWQHAIYAVDKPNSSYLHTPMNKGNEAMPYLTYLVDNYDRLPSTIAFMHAHHEGYPKAWHNELENYDAVAMLHSLNIDFIQRNGYANLRCIEIPGCPDEVQPFRDPPEAHRTTENAMADAWRELFNNSTVPRTIATPCCGQFAVSRVQVLKRPKSDYERYRDWLIQTPLTDDISGRILEYLWHIIFGKDAVYCPTHEQCYCDVFRRDC